MLTLDLDHDLTKAKITPSVSLVNDIPISTAEIFLRERCIYSREI